MIESFGDLDLGLFDRECLKTLVEWQVYAKRMDVKLNNFLSIYTDAARPEKVQKFLVRPIGPRPMGP